MPELSITVGDLRFTGRWEAAAPKTVDVVRRMLPLRNKLIHCRWSGEGCWIPFGDAVVDVPWENHTSHPAPGEVILYPGGFSEGEILVAYGGVTFSSKHGQLSANHFATITGVADGSDLRDTLREMGRRVLWDGAQDITIEERA